MTSSQFWFSWKSFFFGVSWGFSRSHLASVWLFLLRSVSVQLVMKILSSWWIWLMSSFLLASIGELDTILLLLILWNLFMLNFYSYCPLLRLLLQKVSWFSSSVSRVFFVFIFVAQVGISFIVQVDFIFMSVTCLICLTCWYGWIRCNFVFVEFLGNLVTLNNIWYVLLLSLLL